MNFKPVFVEGTTLDDTWKQLLYQVYQHGREYKITRGSYEGSKRLEFDFVSGFIQYPHTRPLAPIMEGSTVPPPTTDEDIETYFANYIMDPTLADNEHYKYSTWINKALLNKYKYNLQYLHETPVEWVIKHFQEAGYGNAHCYITIGGNDTNFEYDKPYETEQERGTSPCLRGLDFKIVNNTLLTHVNYRSWDCFSGWPTNMGGFTLLNEYIANHLEGVEPGPLSFACKSLHAYDFQIEPIKMILKR